MDLIPQFLIFTSSQDLVISVVCCDNIRFEVKKPHQNRIQVYYSCKTRVIIVVIYLLFFFKLNFSISRKLLKKNIGTYYSTILLPCIPKCSVFYAYLRVATYLFYLKTAWTTKNLFIYKSKIITSRVLFGSIIYILNIKKETHMKFDCVSWI